MLGLRDGRRLWICVKVGRIEMFRASSILGLEFVLSKQIDSLTTVKWFTLIDNVHRRVTFLE